MSRKLKEGSQIQRIIERLEEVGYVDNFWAIANRILRLGAHMHTIRHGSVTHNLPPRKLIGVYGADLTDDPAKRKNFYYMTEAAHERGI